MVSHDCRLEVLASDVGNLKESDLDKCRACSIREGASRRAHILLFNLECPKNIKNAAEESDITVGSFYVIYDLLNHLRELVLEVVTPLEKTELSGTAEIKRVFHIYSLKRNNIICGSRVASGTVSVGDEFELCRSSEVLCTGESGLGEGPI